VRPLVANIVWSSLQWSVRRTGGSSILAAMQRDGKAVSEAISELQGSEEKYATKEEVGKVEKMITELKRKNPSLNV